MEKNKVDVPLKHNPKPHRMTFRIIHRYLGYFLAGIMMIYAVSGITLIFRNTDTFKRDVLKEITVEPGLNEESLGRALRIRDLAVIDNDGTMVVFEQGVYNSETGESKFTAKELPGWLDKLTHLHKATTNDPLYYFNIFFGLSVLFFSVSAFFMFARNSSIMKKGLLFTLGGIILAIIMLMV